MAKEIRHDQAFPSLDAGILVLPASKIQTVIPNAVGFLRNDGSGVFTYVSQINLTSQVTGVLPAGNLPSNVVYTDNVQTISGAKTLTGVLYVGSSAISLYKSGDSNSLHLALGNSGSGLLPSSTDTASNGNLGIDAYRWKTVYAGDGNFSGTVLATGGILISGRVSIGSTGNTSWLYIGNHTATGSGESTKFKVDIIGGDWADNGVIEYSFDSFAATNVSTAYTIQRTSSTWRHASNEVYSNLEWKVFRNNTTNVFEIYVRGTGVDFFTLTANVLKSSSSLVNTYTPTTATLPSTGYTEIAVTVSDQPIRVLNDIAYLRNTSLTRNTAYSITDLAQVATLLYNGTSILASHKVQTIASTTASASLRILAGVAPTSPGAGDIWNDGGYLVWRNSTGTRYLAQTAGLTNNIIPKASGTAIFVDSLLSDTGTEIQLSSGLLRIKNALATDAALVFTKTGDTASQFVGYMDGNLEWGAGGATARDTNLYRSSANILKTDDTFEALNLRTINGTISAARALSTNDFIYSSVTGEATRRFLIRVNGQMFWGDGTNAYDVTLYRASADNLKTEDNFEALSFVKTGGTSSQFLKADGSVDSSTYLTGNQTTTLSGEATGSGTTAITVTLTNASVTGKLLTGYVVGANTALLSTDSILTAFQKLQGQVNMRLTTNLDITLTGEATGTGGTSINVVLGTTAVTGKTLSGYVVGANTAITSSDSILGAFQKVQGQLNAKVATNAWNSQTIGIVTVAGNFFAGSAVGDMYVRFADFNKAVLLGVYDDATSGNSNAAIWYTKSGAGAGRTFDVTGLFQAYSGANITTTSTSPGIVTWTGAPSIASGQAIGVFVGKGKASLQSGGITWVQGATDALSYLSLESYNQASPVYIKGTSVNSPSLTLTAQTLNDFINANRPTFCIGQNMAGNDYWQIYGAGSASDNGYLVFEVGDNSDNESFVWRMRNTTASLSYDRMILSASTLTVNVNASFNGSVLIASSNSQVLFIGDDSSVGDCNSANTLRIRGVQDITKGYLRFGGSTVTDGGTFGFNGTYFHTSQRISFDNPGTDVRRLTVGMVSTSLFEMWDNNVTTDTTYWTHVPIQISVGSSAGLIRLNRPTYVGGTLETISRKHKVKAWTDSTLVETLTVDSHETNTFTNATSRKNFRMPHGASAVGLKFFIHCLHGSTKHLTLSTYLSDYLTIGSADRFIFPSGFSEYFAFNINPGGYAEVLCISYDAAADSGNGKNVWLVVHVVSAGSLY